MPAGGHSGCEEACSLRLVKDFKPAHLSPEDLLDIVPAPSISLGHDRLISSWEQEIELLVAHSLGTHKEGNSCALSPLASPWIYIVITVKKNWACKPHAFDLPWQQLCCSSPLCGFAFSVLWHLKPTADVKTELDFPELSTCDGRLVRPLKPQRCMGGEGVLWTARHRRERRWLFTACHSESPLNPSQRWGNTVLVKVPCFEWNRKKTPWIVDTRTSVEKTLLFEMKNSSTGSRSPLGSKVETLHGARSLKTLNEEFTN